MKQTWGLGNGFERYAMHIWVDADACPGVIKDILFRTADIPLAADVVARDAYALSPKGELYGKENIRELLDLRNFMDTLRSTGVDTGGPAPFSAADRQNFANRLDRLLRSQKRL